MSAPNFRCWASQCSIPHMAARFLRLRVSVGLLDHSNLVVGEAVQLVNEGVDFAAGGINLALKNNLLVVGARRRLGPYIRSNPMRAPVAAKASDDATSPAR